MATKNPLIIEAGHRQSTAQRTVGTMLQAFFWAAWLNLWLPLITLAAWGHGAWTAHEQYITRKGLIELVRLLPWFVFGVVLFAALVIAWARLQKHLWHRSADRTRTPEVSTQQVANLLGLDEQKIQVWRNSRALIAHHDASGLLLEFVVAWPVAPAATAAVLPALGETMRGTQAYEALQVSVGPAALVGAVEGATSLLQSTQPLFEPNDGGYGFGR